MTDATTRLSPASAGRDQVDRPLGEGRYRSMDELRPRWEAVVEWGRSAGA
ncbi:MAG: hypothetical protein R2909_21245 [Gemmatimonadales bacterium]